MYPYKSLIFSYAVAIPRNEFHYAYVIIVFHLFKMEREAT